MDKEPDIRFSRREVEPPATPLDYQPSIWIYVALGIFAALLMGVAFVDELDITGLALNLATEIIGAIIILIVVDRRIRSDELKMPRWDGTELEKVRPKYWFVPYNAILYGRMLEQQIGGLASQLYVPRPEIENLLDEHPQGFILIGHAGTGKTTLVQVIAMNSIKKFLDQPRRSRIPIFVPLREWTGDMPFAEYVYNTLSKYQAIKYPKFDSWLKQGKFVVILDGIDESRDTQAAMRQISQFKSLYDKNAMIITSRHHVEKSELPHELPIVTMQGFTQAQAQDYLKRVGIPNELYDLIRSIAQEFTSNPLLLTMLAFIARQSGSDIPQNRSDIFDMFVKILLSRLPANLEHSNQEILSCLTDVAKTMTKAELTIICGDEITPNCAAIIEFCTTTVGLLIETSPNCYSFTHQSLQEYFYARSIK